MKHKSTAIFAFNSQLNESIELHPIWKRLSKVINKFDFDKPVPKVTPQVLYEYLHDLRHSRVTHVLADILGVDIVSGLTDSFKLSCSSKGARRVLLGAVAYTAGVPDTTVLVNAGEMVAIESVLDLYPVKRGKKVKKVRTCISKKAFESLDQWTVVNLHDSVLEQTTMAGSDGCPLRGVVMKPVSPMKDQVLVMPVVLDSTSSLLSLERKYIKSVVKNRDIKKYVLDSK